MQKEFQYFMKLNVLDTKVKTQQQQQNTKTKHKNPCQSDVLPLVHRDN